MDPGLIAVIRTLRSDEVMPVCEALVAGGFKALEITLTVPDALSIVRVAAGRYGTQAVVGVGTVLDGDQARAALGAGAEFIVSPITRLELVGIAHAAERPIMLGAYTPTEAQTAHEAGADFVKIFPADRLGAGYIKAIRAPLPHLRIVPTGGVDLNTVEEFLKAGCAALGLGSALVAPELVREGKWSELTRAARSYVEAVARIRRA